MKKGEVGKRGWGHGVYGFWFDEGESKRSKSQNMFPRLLNPTHKEENFKMRRGNTIFLTCLSITVFFLLLPSPVLSHRRLTRPRAPTSALSHPISVYTYIYNWSIFWTRNPRPFNHFLPFSMFLSNALSFLFLPFSLWT